MEKPKPPISVLWILGALYTVSPFSIDMYLPGFERIAEHFGTSAARVSLSLSSYFVGLGIGQLIYGPLLDRFGRKRPMYFGLSLYICASVTCAYSASVESLITARFFQALGGCSAQVATTAMVRDFYSPKDGAKVFSRLMLILSVSPLFAPTVGSWVIAAFGWRMVFWILAVIVTLFLSMVVFFLPESHHSDPSVRLRPLPILRTFGSVLKNRQFFAFTLSGAFSFAGLFTYLAGAPSLFLNTMQLSEKSFGLVFAFLSVGMVGGGQFSILLSRWFSTRKIFQSAIRVQFVMALFFLLGSSLDWFGLYGYIATFFVFISCVGLTYPNAAALALAPFEKNVGSASAVLGAMQMAVGAASGAVFSLLDGRAAMVMGIVFVVTSFTALFVFESFHSKIKAPFSPT